MSYNTGVCRSCMIGNIEMLNLSQTSAGENSTLELCEIFSECTNLKIDMDDILPKQICIHCEKELKIAYHFKKRSEKSDRMFRELHLIKDVRVCIKDIFIGSNSKDGITMDKLLEPSSADFQKTNSIIDGEKNIKSSPDIAEAPDGSGIIHNANGNFGYLY